MQIGDKVQLKEYNQDATIVSILKGASKVKVINTNGCQTLNKDENTVFEDLIRVKSRFGFLRIVNQSELV